MPDNSDRKMQRVWPMGLTELWDRGRLPRVFRIPIENSDLKTTAGLTRSQSRECGTAENSPARSGGALCALRISAGEARTGIRTALPQARSATKWSDRKHLFKALRVAPRWPTAVRNRPIFAAYPPVNWRAIFIRPFGTGASLSEALFLRLFPKKPLCRSGDASGERERT